MDTVLKRERSKRKTMTQARLLELLSSKEFLGMAGTLAGVYFIPRIRWAEDDAANAAAVGLLTTAVVLMGLGQAGVGDNTTLAVAAAAGLSESFAGLTTGEKTAVLVGGAGAGLLAFLSGFLPALAGV